MRLLSICKALGLIHIIMEGGGVDENKRVSKRKKRKLLGYESKRKWQWFCFRWFSAQMLSSVNAQNAPGFALTFLSCPGNHLYYTATPPPAEFSILRYLHCSLSWACRNFSSPPDVSWHQHSRCAGQMSWTLRELCVVYISYAKGKVRTRSQHGG